MKIIKVTKCADCPYRGKWDCVKGLFIVCNNATKLSPGEEVKTIDNLEIIPEWCPLEDAEEKTVTARIEERLQSLENNAKIFTDLLKGLGKLVGLEVPTEDTRIGKEEINGKD